MARRLPLAPQQRRQAVQRVSGPIGRSCGTEIAASRISGVADHEALDDEHALAIGREIIACGKLTTSRPKSPPSVNTHFAKVMPPLPCTCSPRSTAVPRSAFSAIDGLDATLLQFMAAGTTRAPCSMTMAAPFGTIDWLAIPKGTRAKSVGALHALGNVLVLALFGTTVTADGGNALVQAADGTIRMMSIGESMQGYTLVAVNERLT